MGAFWHILVPYQISIPNKPAIQQDFDEKYGEDFTYQQTRNYVVESAKFSDGTTMKFPREEKDYCLPLEIIRKEFLPFYKVMIAEWNVLYEKKFRDKFPQQIDNFPDLEKCLAEIDQLLQTHDFNKKALKNDLQKIERNYFLHVDSLADNCMYEGYPLEDGGENSSMNVLVLWHSYEKMGVYTKETVAFDLLAEILKEKYSETFVMAKYVFVGGY